MKKIHFIAGRAPAQNPLNKILLLNHCSELEWPVVDITREVTPQKSQILTAGKQGPQLVAVDVVYCAITEEQFLADFGKPYSIEAAIEIMAEIEKKVFEPEEVTDA